jgi:hypothetical protein
MKTNQNSVKAIFGIALLFVVAFVASVTFLVSCNKEDSTKPVYGVQDSQATPLNCSEPSYVFPAKSHPFGKSYSEWADSFFNWEYGFTCENFPYYDQTGALQNQNQSGHVFFLGGAPRQLPPLRTMREVTIPKNTCLFMPIIYYYANDCAAAPGGDLVANATEFSTYMNQLSLKIDGVPVDLSEFLTITPIFNYVANADLVNCTGDLCFDGHQHPVCMSGYWVILKPLSKGTHTIRTTGGTTLDSRIKDVTWTIHQS